MQEQRNHTPADEDAHADREVMLLLTDPEDQRPWTEDDLKRQLDAPVAAADTIGRLRRAGLVVRTSEGLVFATRAAIHAAQIED